MSLIHVDGRYKKILNSLLTIQVNIIKCQLTCCWREKKILTRWLCRCSTARVSHVPSGGLQFSFYDWRSEPCTREEKLEQNWADTKEWNVDRMGTGSGNGQTQWLWSFQPLSNVMNRSPHLKRPSFKTSRCWSLPSLGKPPTPPIGPPALLLTSARTLSPSFALTNLFILLHLISYICSRLRVISDVLSLSLFYFNTLFFIIATT